LRECRSGRNKRFEFPGPSLQEVGFYARKMYPRYNHLNMPTWITGLALGEGSLIDRANDVLKVWRLVFQDV